MLTMRRSVEREQKNVAEVDENSLMVQPPSIQASMAVMNTWVRLAPATNGRDSMMVPCMLRTTYHALKNTARVDCVSIQCSATRDTGWESFVSARRIAVTQLNRCVTPSAV